MTSAFGGQYSNSRATGYLSHPAQAGEGARLIRRAAMLRLAQQQVHDRQHRLDREKPFYNIYVAEHFRSSNEERGRCYTTPPST